MAHSMTAGKAGSSVGKDVIRQANDAFDLLWWGWWWKGLDAKERTQETSALSALFHG